MAVDPALMGACPTPPQRGLELDSKKNNNNHVAHGSIPIRMALARGPLHEDLTPVPNSLTKLTVVFMLGRILFDP